MKKVVIFSLDDVHTRDAILALQDNKIIEIKEWIGNEVDESVTFSYYGLRSEKTINKYYDLCDVGVYQEVYKELYLFLDTFARLGQWPVYEAINYFNMWTNFYYTMFKRNQIDLVIFDNVPHFGCDTIAKSVADAMKIKTLMMHECFEANRFFAYTHIEDVGYFQSCPNDEQYPYKLLEKKYEKHLFYMENIPLRSRGIEFDDMISLLKRCSVDIGDKLNNVEKCDGKEIVRFISDTFRALRQSCCEKKYEIDYGKTAVTEIDIDCQYIYFPLHYQPEMTTSGYGMIYCDQLLAIERLVQILPEDWRIYIKENPKQTFYMRETNFFKRLSLIPNVVFVRDDYDTYKLIENSQFVATITGTAGWEAITGGKNVLVFGLAWYRKLPGVFEYGNDFSLDEILSYKINHQELEIAYNDLIGCTYEGVTKSGHEVNVKGYDIKKNNETVYQSLYKIIAKL